MADIRITNCHIHTFTDRHVPRLYPHPLLWVFKRIPGLVRLLAFFCRLLGQEGVADSLNRLHAFQEEAGAVRQSDILDKILPQYPAKTRFVVLPLDLSGIGHGLPRAGLQAQHDELAAMARDPRYVGRVIPFANCDPRQPGAAQEVRRAIEELGFCGLKLYPRCGFDPDHPVLMNDVYPLLQARGLPVLSHCSRGGVVGKGICQLVADSYCSPEAFVPVLKAFPGLRVNLAHFGGQQDWRRYVQVGVAPNDPLAAADNWQVLIRQMIASGDYPNLWTDISYTLFHFEDFVPFLRLFLEDSRLARRVLFGSDFYMTRQEALSERAVCFRLRVALGEDLFRQVAQVNPEVWLGERLV